MRPNAGRAVSVTASSMAAMTDKVVGGAFLVVRVGRPDATMYYFKRVCTHGCDVMLSCASTPPARSMNLQAMTALLSADGVIFPSHST